MLIHNIMSVPPLVVSLDDTVGKVKDLFASHHIRHMMVVEDCKLAGALCEAELMRVVSPYLESHVYSTRDLATLNQRVHQVMSRGTKRLPQTATVLQAMKLFNVYAVCCIPVVDENDVPVGIVTRSNLIKFIQHTFSKELDSE
jgi:acetoin utilization protein AcuB